MSDERGIWPETAVVFGASGGIGRALSDALETRGCKVWRGGRSLKDNPEGRTFRFDFSDEQTLSDIAAKLKDVSPQLVIVATGVLTLDDGAGPERSFKRLDAATMAEVLRINTIGPALVAKHMLPLLPRDRRCVFAALSARVGSIGDNALGGWHSYRASKAALNMLLKNFAIELGRTHDEAMVVGLHPGTVDTALSEPFQSGLPEGQLTTPEDAASNLLAVIDALGPDDSGKVFDWKGERIPD